MRASQSISVGLRSKEICLSPCERQQKARGNITLSPEDWRQSRSVMPLVSCSRLPTVCNSLSRTVAGQERSFHEQLLPNFREAVRRTHMNRYITRISQILKINQYMAQDNSNLWGRYDRSNMCRCKMMPILSLLHHMKLDHSHRSSTNFLQDHQNDISQCVSNVELQTPFSSLPEGCCGSRRNYAYM